MTHSMYFFLPQHPHRCLEYETRWFIRVVYVIRPPLILSFLCFFLFLTPFFIVGIFFLSLLVQTLYMLSLLTSTCYYSCLPLLACSPLHQNKKEINRKTLLTKPLIMVRWLEEHTFLFTSRANPYLWLPLFHSHHFLYYLSTSTNH